jgi:hypothetical protein
MIRTSGDVLSQLSLLAAATGVEMAGGEGLATKLFLPRGGHRFLSRTGYPPCKRETRSDRLLRKARRLHHALGDKGDPLVDRV